MIIKQEKHYGSSVWTNITADERRKKECMCFVCKRFPYCLTAKRLYKICKDKDMALSITRCKKWKAGVLNRYV